MRKIIGARLEEEREKLKKKKGEMAELGGVVGSAYTNYINGDRVPDAEFLAAIAIAGADVIYILTGIRSNSTPIVSISLNAEESALVQQALSKREEALIDNYRHIADEEDRKAVERTAFMAARPINRDETQSRTNKKAG